MRDKRISLYNYRAVIPQILIYQFISKAALLLAMYAYRQLTGFLLWRLDRPAFTSGDLPYLMRSWEGWLLILLGFAALVIYTVFDINAVILISDRLLHQKKLEAFSMLREAFGRLQHFRGFRGVLAVLYVSLLAPLAGAAFGISLTADFVIPEFILSVIQANVILRILYGLALVILSILGIIYIFTFHYAILGDLDIKDAMARSKAVMKVHWKNFLWQYFIFFLKWLLLGAGIMIVLGVIPLFILELLPLGEYARHAGILFFLILCILLLAVYSLSFLYFRMMKLTILYRSYGEDKDISYSAPDRKKYRIASFAAVAFLTAILAASLWLAADFDTNFPAAGEVSIIAHRGGGTLANENTVLSLEAAIEKHAVASEIDVQRTKDGHYIINHDGDFKRCCGVAKKPGEMTLAEIKELEVINEQNPLAPATEVAALEEMLDAAKGRIRLYIELKGESADSQMAEDIYHMAKERGMLKDCVLISLDYKIIDEIETKYPKLQTGYLCYFSFGNIADMNCDLLLLEAETATQSNVDKIHKAGKEVNVWTVNTLNAMTSFLASDVDGIITDEVAQAEFVQQLLAGRDDVERVLQQIAF